MFEPENARQAMPALHPIPLTYTIGADRVGGPLERGTVANRLRA
jgi:hypothetical protein